MPVPSDPAEIRVGTFVALKASCWPHGFAKLAFGKDHKEAVCWGRIEKVEGEGKQLQLSLAFTDSDELETWSLDHVVDWSAQEPVQFLHPKYTIAYQKAIKARRDAQMRQIQEDTSTNLQADSVPTQANTRPRRDTTVPKRFQAFELVSEPAMANQAASPSSSDAPDEEADEWNPKRPHFENEGNYHGFFALVPFGLRSEWGFAPFTIFAYLPYLIPNFYDSFGSFPKLIFVELTPS